MMKKTFKKTIEKTKNFYSKISGVKYFKTFLFCAIIFTSLFSFFANPQKVSSGVGQCPEDYPYLLSVFAMGDGSGEVSGGCYGYYETGFANASPYAGSEFDYWAGDCYADGSVTMDSDKTCYAYFKLSAASCSSPWGGASIASGSSVTAYATSTVAYGSSCSAQTRTCTNGSLSGSYTYASCSVNPPSGCYQLPWGSIAHGASVTAYPASTVPYGAMCFPETRTCTNGTLSGSGAYDSCTVSAAANCNVQPWGEILNGNSVTAYSSPNPTGACSSQTRSCSNGTLSGSYSYNYCNAGCTGTPWGNVSHGYSNTAYASSTADTCSSQTRTCSSGTLSGSYTATSCTVNSYTYYFNGNGADTNASPTSRTLTYGSTLSAPTAPSRTGYTFAGWSPAIPATMPSGGGTSNAQWTANTYSISWTATNGSASPASCTYGATVNPTCTPGTGYSTSSCPAAFTCGTSNSKTATFTPNTYSISYSITGSGSVSPASCTYGTTVTPTCTPGTGYNTSSCPAAFTCSTSNSKSATFVDNIAPSTPGAMTTSWSGDHYVNTNFAAATTGSSDSGSGISYYNLCRSADNSSGCYTWVATGIGTSTTVSGTHLPSPGTYRYYYWYAYDAAGNQSGESSGTYVRMDGAAPSAPGAMTTSWTGDHYVNTNFTAATSGSSDAGIGVSSYSLCRSADNTDGCNTWVATGIGTSTTVSGTHLPSPGTYRYYYWYAYDSFGNQSGASSGTYVRMDTSVPSISDISATNAPKGSSVRFYVTASDTGSGINTGNALFYLGTYPYSSWNRVSGGTMGWDGSRYYYDVTLNDPYGTTYRAFSYVYDNLGNRGERDENPTEFSITNTAPPISSPSAPGNGATVNGNGSNVTFTTNAVSDVDGQTVQYYYRVATGSDAESGVVCNSGWTTSTSYGCNPGPGTFYWHVYTYDGVTQTNPNYVWSFYNNYQPSWVSVSPTSGSFPSGARTFTTVYRDPNGATDISYVHLLMNYGVDGNSTAFYGLYYRGSNSCHLFNSDNAGAWAAQDWKGAPAVLPWVTLNSCSSSASGTDLTVTWNLTFNTWNESGINEYLYVGDNSSSASGWNGPYGTFLVDTTAPSVQTGIGGGWNPGTNIDASDGLSGLASYTLYVNDTARTWQNYSNICSNLGLGDGTNTIRVVATDNAGNSNSTGNQSFSCDRTAPTFSSKTGYSGWYRANQTSTFSYTDATSGIASGNNPSCTISSEGTGQTCSVTPNVCDAAGNCNTTAVTSNGANIDKTAPYLNSKTSYSGWYNTNQSSVFTYADAVSGVASGNSPSCTISSEGAGQTCSVTPNVCDTAGNCNATAVTSNGANIDKTAPVYNSTSFEGCNYESGDNCYVKNGTTFYVNVNHSDALSGTNTQYFELSKDGANRGTWDGATGNIKSYAYPYGVSYGGYYSSFTDGGGMEGTGYMDIQNAQCIQTGNCNSTALGKWKVVASSGASRMYGVTVYMYDQAHNGVGYTTTSKYVYLDNDAPSITTPTDGGATSVSTSLSFSSSPSDAMSGLSTCYAQVDINNTDGASLAMGTTDIGSDGDHTITGAKGNTYYYRYYCTDRVGNSSGWSSWSDGIYIMADQAALSITTTTATYGSNLSLATSGGSGSGAVSYGVRSGTCTISGSTLTPTAAGSCVVYATKAGDGSYNATTSADATVTINKANQAALSFSGQTVTYPSGFATLSTTGGSGGGAVSYAVTTAGAGCSISGATLSYSSAGSCGITATKAGDSNYNATSSAATFTINKASQATLTTTAQTITYGASFAALASTGGSGSGAVTFALTDAGTAGCSVSGTTLSYTSAGTCTVTATKAADTNYLVASSAAQTFTVNKANQAALTVTNTSGTYPTGFTVGTSGGSGTGAVTFSVAAGTATGCTIVSGTGALTFTSAGTCTVTATKAGDTNYNSVSSSATTVTINKASQATLTTTAQTITYGASFAALASTGGSGSGAVTFALTDAGTAGCSVSGTTLTYTSAGTCTVVATKATDTNYLVASSAAQTFTVNKANQAALTVTTVSVTYGTDLTLSTEGGSGTGGVSYVVNSGSCTISGNILTPTASGSCSITATKATDTNYNSVSSSAITITISQKQLTISNPTLTISKAYDGNTSAVVVAGSLSGVETGDTVTVSAVATYDSAVVGSSKTITVVYTLGGVSAGKYIKPVNYVVTTGKIMAVLSYSAGANGTLTGSTSQTVDYGGSGTAITAVPNTGYHFVKWSDDSVSNPRTDTSVTSSISVTASFAIDTFTITATSGANGTITPSGVTTKDYGTSQVYTITPSDTYHIVDVVVDGVSVGAVSSYTFSSITAAHTISVSFAINTYLVSASANVGGTITPASTIVNHGASTTFTVTPNSGYSVSVSGCGGSLLGNTYTTGTISSACTVTATFTGSVPAVISPVSSSITTTTATLGANVTSLGGPASISARGICYGTSASPTNCVNATGTTTGSFTLNISSLSLCTQYYYRGFATNATGTGYSSDGTFTTSCVVLPTVTTQAVSSIGVTTATANGNITNTGNETNDKRGIVYDLISRALPGNVAPASSLYSNKIEAIGSFVTGPFISLMTNLIADTTYYIRAYSHNSSGYSYGNEVSFKTNLIPTISLSGYRFFNNLDSASVGSALSSQNTSYTLAKTGSAFRLRLLIGINGSNISQGGESFKLQYAERSGSCDVSFSGESYADVTSRTDIAYNNNFSVDSGSAMISSVNDPAHGADTIISQTYVDESENFTNELSSVSVGQYGKWDLSLYDKKGSSNITYCLRVVKSDGGLLDTYSYIPQITTAPYKTSGGGSTSLDVDSASTTTPDAIQTGGSQSGGDTIEDPITPPAGGGTDGGVDQGGGAGDLGYLNEKFRSVFGLPAYSLVKNLLLGFVSNRF